MADLQDIVARGAKAHEAFDAALTAARDAASELSKIYGEAIEGGLFKFNAAKSAYYLAASIDGALVDAGVKSAELHTEGTKAATAASIDLSAGAAIGHLAYPQLKGGPGR